jgi:hypothetical protein
MRLAQVNPANIDGLGNKWSKGKFIPYRKLLGMIEKGYPSISKIGDEPNDTSKVSCDIFALKKIH